MKNISEQSTSTKKKGIVIKLNPQTRQQGKKGFIQG